MGCTFGTLQPKSGIGYGSSKHGLDMPCGLSARMACLLFSRAKCKFISKEMHTCSNRNVHHNIIQRSSEALSTPSNELSRKPRVMTNCAFSFGSVPIPSSFIFSKQYTGACHLASSSTAPTSNVITCASLPGHFATLRVLQTCQFGALL